MNWLWRSYLRNKPLSSFAFGRRAIIGHASNSPHRFWNRLPWIWVFSYSYTNVHSRKRKLQIFIIVIYGNRIFLRWVKVSPAVLLNKSSTRNWLRKLDYAILAILLLQTFLPTVLKSMSSKLLNPFLASLCQIFIKIFFQIFIKKFWTCHFYKSNTLSCWFEVVQLIFEKV